MSKYFNGNGFSLYLPAVQKANEKHISLQKQKVFFTKAITFTNVTYYE